MRNIIQLKWCLSAALAALLLASGVAQAGIIETDTLYSNTQTALNKTAVLNALERKEVQQLLTQRGISQQAAETRINAMTDDEIATLASDVDNLPAGAGLGETLVIAFVILVITDSIGVTDVFPFIHHTHHH